MWLEDRQIYITVIFTMHYTVIMTRTCLIPTSSLLAISIFMHLKMTER